MSRFIAKTFSGLEKILSEELKDIGASIIDVRKRAIIFSGDTGVLYRANLWARTALKMLKSIYEFTARNENDLYKRIQSVQWKEFFDEIGRAHV